MTEILVTLWEDTDIEPLVELAVEQRRTENIAKEPETLQMFTQRLRDNQTRLNYDSVIQFAAEGKSEGWAIIWQRDEGVLRISSWQPYVRDQDSKIAKEIISQIIKIAKERELNRIEFVMNRITDKNRTAFERRMEWYSSQGFVDFYQEYFMVRQLRPDDVRGVDIPSDIKVSTIDEWSVEDVYETYATSFNQSQDRFYNQRTPERRRIRFGEFLKSNHTIIEASHVISKDDSIVGFSIVSKHFGPAHLGPFAVHPDYRRSGKAQLLVYLSIKSLLERGIDRLSLEVDTENKPAFELYRKLGFTRESVAHLLRWTT
ncbi:MAG: GNAT family N-acetyltransferase [Candidatus Thorarchaeota archaeon]